MGRFRAWRPDFEKQFGKPLPVSAMGETAVHRSLGFDHRGRVDVAISPDHPKASGCSNTWSEAHSVLRLPPGGAGKATGAHIHIGPMSTRIQTRRIMSDPYNVGT